MAVVLAQWRALLKHHYDWLGHRGELVEEAGEQWFGAIGF